MRIPLGDNTTEGLPQSGYPVVLHPIMNQKVRANTVSTPKSEANSSSKAELAALEG